MRHDMSQVLSTPHPHATLSRKQPPPAPCLLTTYIPPLPLLPVILNALSRWLRAAFGADVVVVVAQRVEMEM